MECNAHDASSVTNLISKLLELDAQKGLGLLEYRKLTESVPFRVMTGIFAAGVEARVERGDHLYRRVATGISEDGTEITVIDPVTRGQRTMLNFASNSYFGLSKHPDVLRAVGDALAIYGTGPAGSPMLNGTTELHTRLEARIAQWLGKEAVMLFSSGYLANGWPAVAVRPGDLFVWDERLHASVQEGGMKAPATMRGLADPRQRVVTHVFHHNDVQQLENVLRRFQRSNGHSSKDSFDGMPRASMWIAIEGVYSMDGDLAPLPEITEVAERYGAFVVVDDAHGEGVLGRGKGVEHHFAKPSPTFLTVGTLGKAFASGGGGFIAGPKDVIAYLRVYSPTYLYSTSLSTANTAAALAAFDVVEREPWRIEALHENVNYLTAGLRKIGVNVEDRDSGIIGISVPPQTDLRRLALDIHNRGIDIATVEPPVVPLNDQHIRINVSSTHRRQQLDRFLAVLGEFRDQLIGDVDAQETKDGRTCKGETDATCAVYSS